jgi:hypothetical protein
MPVQSNVADKFVYHLETDLFMRLLPSFKPQLDPDFKIVAKELDGVIALHGKIVLINAWGELQFLHPAGRLGRSSLFAALGFFVKEFAVVDDAANRRCRVGGDLDQVQTFSLGQLQGIIKGHDAQRLLGLVKDSDFASPDFSVPAMQRLSGVK